MFERIKRLFQRRRAGDFDSVFSEPEPIDQPEPVPARLAMSRRGSTGTEFISKPPAASSESITVSLRPIVLKLPDILKGKVRQPPSASIRIPVPIEQIIPQLQQGSVKLSFGDIRKAAPTGVFSDAADRDQSLVELPLQEILLQLPPDKLPRRTDQKRIEVPDDVTAIFGTQAHQQGNVRIARSGKSETAPIRTDPSAQPVSPATPANVFSKPASPTQPTPQGLPGSTHKPASPTLASPLGAPGTTHKPLSIPSIPAGSTLPSPSALRPIQSPLPPTSLPSTPIKPSNPLPAPSALHPSAAPPSRPIPCAPSTPQPSKPALQPTVQPTPRSPVPSPQGPVPQPVTPARDDFISVPLVGITTGWPEPIRQALAALNVPDAVLLLPASETEQALKRGKVIFHWKRLKPLIRPPLKTALAPALDEIQLELPLPTIAPIFLAQRKSSTPRKKLAVGEDIPDLFTNRNSASKVESTAPPAPAASTASAVEQPPAPAEPPTTTAAPAPAPLSSAEPVPQDIGELFGQPGRKNWAPAELVQRTAGLPGVAGALITMQDGLLVAAQLPPGLNGDGIAAFLPQMYTRVMQYSKELKFSETNKMTLVIDDVPLRIVKAGGIYFAALGRPRESLPEPQLKIIASHLAPQSK